MEIVEKSLGELAAELNGKIYEYEAFLQSLHFGVPAEVVMDPQTKLGFYKLSANFRLAIKGPGGGEVPLVSSSREVKIIAVGFFFELYEALISNAERERVLLTDTIRILGALLERVKEVASD